MNLSEVGKTIRKRRRDLDMTQSDLGKRVRAVTSHICDLEKGRKIPSLEMLAKLENELGPIWQYNPERNVN